MILTDPPQCLRDRVEGGSEPGEIVTLSRVFQLSLPCPSPNDGSGRSSESKSTLRADPSERLATQKNGALGDRLNVSTAAGSTTCLT